MRASCTRTAMAVAIKSELLRDLLCGLQGDADATYWYARDVPSSFGGQRQVQKRAARLSLAERMLRGVE